MKQKWSRRVNCIGGGARGAVGAGAPYALVVRGQCGGSNVPYQYVNANEIGSDFGKNAFFFISTNFP